MSWFAVLCLLCFEVISIRLILAHNLSIHRFGSRCLNERRTLQQSEPKAGKRYLAWTRSTTASLSAGGSALCRDLWQRLLPSPTGSVAAPLGPGRQLTVWDVEFLACGRFRVRPTQAGLGSNRSGMAGRDHLPLPERRCYRDRLVSGRLRLPVDCLRATPYPPVSLRKIVIPLDLALCH